MRVIICLTRQRLIKVGDYFDYVKHVESRYYGKYKIIKRSLTLISRVRTISCGEKAIEGEIEYLGNQLKADFIINIRLKKKLMNFQILAK